MSENANLMVGDYRLEKTIGQGTYGKVKLGIHMKTNEKVIYIFISLYLYIFIFLYIFYSLKKLYIYKNKKKKKKNIVIN